MRVALASFLLANAELSLAQQPAPTEPNPSKPAAASLRLFSGTVISSSEAGAIIECKPPAAGAQIRGSDAAPASGRFFLRGISELLAPSVEIQFLAVEDGTYRYTDFFQTVATMPALRFVKWEKPPAAAPTPKPSPQPVAKAPTPEPAARTTNPTPRLKGTLLDLPPRRLSR